ncbi:MAG: energy transducer TonB [Terracidiphilus sp.]
MANQLLIETNSESEGAVALAGGHEMDAFLGRAFEEKPIWVGLYESIRDVFFPPKLPPLELTSTPIPVPDRMAVKTNPWAVGISTVVNGALLAIALFVVGRQVIKQLAPQTLQTNMVDVGEFKAPNAAQKAGGGGGGGDHSLIDPTKGKLPKIEKDPPLPPQVQTVDHPILPMDAAINVQQNITLPDNPSMTNLGVKSSVNVKLASNGQGGGGGIGTGYGGGIGSGTGNGYGPGYGGGTGGGVYRIGGNISSPIPIHQVDPEFSDEARRAKYQGVCIVSLIVDAQGNPQNVHVVRALGMGLDEKAIEAVKQYRFKPALRDGKTPVAVSLNIEINFRLY